MNQQVQSTLASMTFRSFRGFTDAYNRLSLPVISTGRSFRYYRRLFFNGDSATQVLRDLRQSRILDIGCGLTPYVNNSMFQACYRAQVEFYGIDPKLGQGFRLGAFDRAKTLATGGVIDPNPPGLERAIAASADDLPFADESVDLILSCYLLHAWIIDERLLDGIFKEFYRVLKPGGRVKIFPAPPYVASRIRYPELRRTLAGFSVEEKFYAGVIPRTRFPPAYMRTLHKST